MDWWQSDSRDGATIGCVPAQHFSGRSAFGRNSTLWCGWTLRVGERSLFFVGDSAVHPEFGAIADRFGPFSVVLMPIGAYNPRWFMSPVHMDPSGAIDCFVEACRSSVSAAFGRCVMVGIHWGTFKLSDEPIDEPPKLTRALWDARRLPPDDLWILSHGETRTL
jgi:N-acyl-phosphatidylethanolamine-hydrolysing phospholipase D